MTLSGIGLDQLGSPLLLGIVLALALWSVVVACLVVHLWRPRDDIQFIAFRLAKVESELARLRRQLDAPLAYGDMERPAQANVQHQNGRASGDVEWPAQANVPHQSGEVPISPAVPAPVTDIRRDAATRGKDANRPPAASINQEHKLYKAAEAALTSPEGFRRFAEDWPGLGYTLGQGKPALVPLAASTPASSADIWVVTDGGRRLAFPGFNLRRSQSALLADQGRLAQDRLGWLFTVEAGEQFAARHPAVLNDRNELLHRGVLSVPK